MSVSMADITPLFRKVVTFSVADGDVPTEITGKVLAVSNTGVVVRFKGNPRIILIEDILDHNEVSRPRRKRVVRRVVRRIPAEVSVKQHLADRHALFMSLVHAIDEETAHEIHEQINHSDLGHFHREPDEAITDLDDDGEVMKILDE